MVAEAATPEGEGVVLEVAEKGKMVDAFGEELDVPDEHGGGGGHALFVGDAHDSEPVVGGAFAVADDSADARGEDFGAAAGDGVEAGGVEAAEDVADVEAEEAFELDEFRG